MYGPELAFSDELDASKYRGEGETFRESCYRVASPITDDDAHYKQLSQILLEQRFLPAGRVRSAVGSLREVTPYNCLAGDVSVLTANGVHSIQSLDGLEIEILSPITRQFHKTVVKSYGQREIVEIEIAYGFRRNGATFKVKATPDHRWLLQDGSFTVELSEGDLLAVSGLETTDIDLDGFVHGFCFGDGTRDKSCTITPTWTVPLCSGKDQEFVQLFDDHPWVSSRWDGYGWPLFRVKPTNGEDLKELPTITDPAYVGGFIRGWIAADGSIVSGRIPDVLHSINLQALEWVKDRMPLAGRAVCGGVHITPAGSPTTFGPRKRDLGCLYHRMSYNHRGRRVVSIEPAGNEEVYCVEVPEGGYAFTINAGLATGNCYVSGTIEDSMVEGHASIMQRLLEAAATMRMGGGIGYDFSTLRPHLDLIKTQQTYASGPVSFMQPFDAVCKTIASAGHRRGAQMAVMRVDHPDVETFINAKHPTAETRVLWELVDDIADPNTRTRAARALQQTLPLAGFNMSLAITDEFMECLAAGRPFPLQFGGQRYREVDPSALWEMVMRSTWDWAEPGVLFVDTINRMNNLWYCETIAATNPCGEQPLPPHGACLLGSFNLVKYLLKSGNTYYFHWDQLAADIPPVVRAMDNIIDLAKYPLYEQQKEAKSKRRMGLGVTGLANCLEALGLPYGSPEFVRMESDILNRLAQESYLASIELAREKGPFKLFDAQHYLAGQFIKGLREDVRDGIARHGIRNSHLTSIAPTGTISLCADNISSGVEPVFDYSFKRDIRLNDGPSVETVDDYGVRVLGTRGRRSADVTVQEHLDVLVAASEQVDSAVSKTCNVSGGTPWIDFKQVYVDAWARGCKGLTTFQIDGKRLGIFSVSEDDAQASETDPTCYIDPTTGRHECE